MSTSSPSSLAFAQLVQAELGTLGYESRISISKTAITVVARDVRGQSNGQELTTLSPGVTPMGVARELARGLAPPDPGMIQAVWGGQPTPSERGPAASRERSDPDSSVTPGSE